MNIIKRWTYPLIFKHKIFNVVFLTNIAKHIDVLNDTYYTYSSTTYHFFGKGL